jgi:hypothetical protein
MGYRAWDHLWNLAKAVPQVSEATRAVNLTTAIRIGQLSRRSGRGGTRTTVMSPVDIKNALNNLDSESFKTEMVRDQHQQQSRIAEVDTDSGSSEFVPMSSQRLRTLSKSPHPSFGGKRLEVLCPHYSEKSGGEESEESDDDGSVSSPKQQVKTRRVSLVASAESEVDTSEKSGGEESEESDDDDGLVRSRKEQVKTRRASPVASAESEVDTSERSGDEDLDDSDDDGAVSSSKEQVNSLVASAESEVDTSKKTGEQEHDESDDDGSVRSPKEQAPSLKRRRVSLVPSAESEVDTSEKSGDEHPDYSDDDGSVRSPKEQVPPLKKARISLVASAESEVDMSENQDGYDGKENDSENIGVDGMELDEVDSRTLENQVVDEETDIPTTLPETMELDEVDSRTLEKQVVDEETDIPTTLPETMELDEVDSRTLENQVVDEEPDIPTTLPETEIQSHKPTPKRVRQRTALSIGRPYFPRAAIVDPNPKAKSFPAALSSTGVWENINPEASDGHYELGAHFERLVGPGSLDALERGEELRFSTFGSFEGNFRAAVRLDIELYLAHCPTPLTVGCLLPNMVHSVGQQHARRSLRLWIVAACLYGTHELLAIPRPGEFSGTIQDGTPVVDDSWEYATVSKENGIRIPWLCVEIIPAHLVRSGSGSHERSGIDMIREAHSRLRSVVYDTDTGFSSSDFVDHLATPLAGVGPVSQALCGMVDWKDASVIEYMKLLSATRVFDDYCLEMDGFSKYSLMTGAKIAFQRDYIRHGHASLLAKKWARIKDTAREEWSREDIFVHRMIAWVGDLWHKKKTTTS